MYRSEHGGGMEPGTFEPDVDVGWLEALREEANLDDPEIEAAEVPDTRRAREELGRVVEAFGELSGWFERVIEALNEGARLNSFLVRAADPSEIRVRGEGYLSVIHLGKRLQMLQVYIPPETRLQQSGRNFLTYGKLLLHNAQVPLGTTEYAMGLLPERGELRWMLHVNEGDLIPLDLTIRERLIEWLVSRDRWLTSIRLF